MRKVAFGVLFSVPLIVTCAPLVTAEVRTG